MNSEDRIQETGFRIQNSEEPKQTSTPNSTSPATDSRLLAPDSCPSARAFTQIELMAVIAIIAILMGIVLGTAKYAQTKGARSRAEAEIATMENALERFRNDWGYYPLRPSASADDLYSSTNIYNALAGASAAYGSKVYMSFRPNQLNVVIVAGQSVTNIVDPFGVNYRYLCPGTNNPTGFDLWSYGPDSTNGLFGGVEHDIDNITNWRRN